jgi:hypothetical protein
MKSRTRMVYVPSDQESKYKEKLRIEARVPVRGERKSSSKCGMGRTKRPRRRGESK